MITRERLIEWVNYDPHTGRMTRRMGSRGAGAHVGDLVGGINAYGRRVTVIDKKRYWVARLAWIYMTGEDPGVITTETATDYNWRNFQWDRLRNSDGETLKEVVERTKRKRETIKRIKERRKLRGKRRVQGDGQAHREIDRHSHPIQRASNR